MRAEQATVMGPIYALAERLLANRTGPWAS
jgi:hypothetical protein